MSISSALVAAQGRVADCYTAISNKGGTLPAKQNLANMPTAIGSIETINATTASVTPTTSAQTITPTSPYNAFDEISVSAVTSSIDNNITAGNIKKDVQILGVTGTYEGGSGTKYGATIDTFIGNVDANNILQFPTDEITLDFSGVEGFVNNMFDSTQSSSIGAPNQNAKGFFTHLKIKNLKCDDVHNIASGSGTYAFRWSFVNSPSIKSVSFKNLEKINSSGIFESAFYNSSVESYDFSSLRYINGAQYLFSNAFGKIDATPFIDFIFPNLIYISSSTYCFNNFAPNRNTDGTIPKINLKRLFFISGLSVFYSCFAGVVDSSNYPLELPSLIRMHGHNNASYAQFYACNKIDKIYLPKLVSLNYLSSTATTYVFNNCPSLVEFHFGKKNQTTIEADGGYATLWGRGAGNATVYFDLINEITCGGDVYYRNAPDDDETNQKYNWCKGGIITVNGVDYERSPSDDATYTTGQSYIMPFAWKQVVGNNKLYTGNVNPIIGEGVLSASDQNYNETKQITAIRGITSVYTDSKYTPIVGDNYYTESGGTYTVAGQITAVA